MERERCLVLVAGLASVKAADSFSIGLVSA